MFFMFAQKNQKAYFLAPQDPKNTHHSNNTIFDANSGFGRMPRQSSPKMSTPP